VQRVLVTGNTGAGKTTAARRLAGRLDLPFHEIDELAFAPGWAESPTYLADVTALADGPAWVLDSWGDTRIRDHLWGRADTLIWLDYPMRVLLPRIVRRSLRRTIRREKIFNGNTETYAEWLHRDHPVWSAIRGHHRRRAEMTRRLPLFPDLIVVRLQAPHETEQWLTTVHTPGPPSSD
jgi:adenylate kinase family enzyme